MLRMIRTLATLRKDAAKHPGTEQSRTVIQKKRMSRHRFAKEASMAVFRKVRAATQKDHETEPKVLLSKVKMVVVLVIGERLISHSPKRQEEMRHIVVAVQTEADTQIEEGVQIDVGDP